MPNQERLQPQWIVPIKPKGIVLTGHELVLCEGRIEQILTSADAEIRYPEAPIKKLSGHVLMPGLINVHGHAAMTLLRGYADDHKLLTWLSDYIWPVEAKVVCPSFVETGAWLAATSSGRADAATGFSIGPTVDPVEAQAGLAELRLPVSWLLRPMGELMGEFDLTTTMFEFVAASTSTRRRRLWIEEDPAAMKLDVMDWTSFEVYHSILPILDPSMHIDLNLLHLLVNATGGQVEYRY